QAIYDARRAAAAEIIANILLDEEARRRKVERAALYAEEITAKARPVSDADVSTWYKANPQQVQGATLDQVRGPILSLLTQTRVQTARDAYVDTLKAKTPVRVMLDPPRMSVSAGNSPAKGPANAAIELIEF